MGPEEIQKHAREYRMLVEALRDDRVDLDKNREENRLNADLSTLLKA